MNKKMAAMFATVIIALSMVGVAYALWDDILLIDGTVSTGNIGLVFEEGYSYDTDDEPYGWDPEIDGLWKKDVSWPLSRYMLICFVPLN